MEKKNYLVEVPVLAKVLVEIEADSKEDAERIAISEADFRLVVNDSEMGYELHEWGVYDRISEGNYYHGLINEVNAEEL